jgi:hypothetical protein
MTVSTLNSSTSVLANGVVRTFYFDFALLETSHLYVYTIDTASSGTQELQSAYEVDEGWGDTGGSITFLVDEQPADGLTVYMDRNVPITQETDYIPGDPFPADSHEDALDKLTMIVQDGNSIFDRSITVPVGDTATDLELPFASARALKYLYFDANGDVAVATSTAGGDVYTSDEVDTLFEDYYTITEIDSLIIDYYNVVGDWNKQQYFGIATVTGTWDLDIAQTAQWTLGASNTMTNPTNQEAGGSYMLKVIQDGTGARTITWGANYKFEDSTDPVISAGADDVTIITFLSDGTYMYGTLQFKETL